MSTTDKGQTPMSKLTGFMKKDLKEAKEHYDHSDLYDSADKFLESITQKIDVQAAVYQCEGVHMLPTKVIEDEYVVVILKIMSEELRVFFGGSYIVQQWAKKKKIFQAVHINKPNRFFLNSQRFIYSLQGNDSECSFLYVVNFFQSIFQKIKHPFYTQENEDGFHDVSVYVDPKQVLVVNGEDIHWAQLKIENLFTQQQHSQSMISEQVSQMPELNNMKSQAFEFVEGEEVKTCTIESDVKFISVLNNTKSDEVPEHIMKVHSVSSEGYMRKKVHFVVETQEKIYILDLEAHKRNGQNVFDISLAFAFEKQFVEVSVMDPIKEIHLENFSDEENLIVIHLHSKELKVFSQSIEKQMIEYAASMRANMDEESDSSDEEEKARIAALAAERQKICYKITHACRRAEPLPVYVKVKKDKTEQNSALSKIKNFFTSEIKRTFFKVKSYYMRRQFIYFIGEKEGEIRRFNTSTLANFDCTTKAQKISYSQQVATLQDVTLHINIFNDFLLANTTLIISHQKILSIFDFLTGQWRHMLPQEQGNKNQDQGQTYFGMPDDEIDQLMLNFIFSNSIYDCIVKYKGKFIRRLKYYNELDKQYFEKGQMFQDKKVLQIQRNVDNRNYRQYGDSTTRTLFLIEDQNLGIQQIWVSENGSRITKFIDNIPLEEHWRLVEIPNARSDMIIMYSGKQRSIQIFNIPNSKQCLYPQQLLKYRTHCIEKIDYDATQKIQYFLFFDKLYFQKNGNLAMLNTQKKGTEVEEINFNCTIREMYMTHHDSVYYKDKNNIFRYAHLTIQKQFNVDKQPTEVVNCRGSFCTRIEYSITTNRIALFTSSFEICVYPLFDRCRIDMMASQDFENNFMCWKQIDNKLIALQKPNILVSWNTDTGKIEKYHKLDFNFTSFKRHTEWNGCTLMKQVKEAKSSEEKKEDATRGNINESFDMENEEGESEEAKLEKERESKHLYSLIEIISPTEVIEHCQFLYDFVPGCYLYMSNPYLLVMDDFCTKFYVIEGKGKLKNMRQLNTFYEPQMKIGRPIYFSPNFFHRIYIDQQTKEVVINFTLTNTNIYNLPIRKQLMFQIEKTHPMIYFHDNDKLVYLTIHGVEKMFQIKRVVGNRKRKGTCQLKEVANIYYNDNTFIRRYILDPLSYNGQQSSQMDKLNILKFRGDILKRHLYLNCYQKTNTEDEKNSLPRYFIDKNVSAFSHFIINNYRQELTFNYFVWKIVENLGKKKVQLRDLTSEFITELSFMILPDNKNILHLLSENYEVLDQYIRYVNNEDLEEVHQNSVKLTEIMFIPDLYGKTPLHYSIDSNNTRVTDRLVKALGYTDFDHHNRFIIDIYAKLIEIVPQQMSVYLSSRLKSPSWIASYTRGRIEADNDTDFVMTADQIWKDDLDASLQGKMYKPEALEVPLEMYILDLPHLHKYENDHADDFLEALANSEHIDVFSNIAVKALIELKWPLVKAAIKKFLFIPYLMFLTVFLIYTVYVFEAFHEASESQTIQATADGNSTTDATISLNAQLSLDEFKDPNFWMSKMQQIFKTLILLFTFYFFSLEIRQMFLAGVFKYMASPWNYLDLIPLFLICMSMFFSNFGFDPSYERPLNAISCFFMWIKFLYFWRIFRQTSKFISMIIAIIVDLKEFLCVFLVTLVAFGQSMYILSNNNSTEEELIAQGVSEDDIPSQKQFINGMADAILFAYRMSLGDFDTSQLGSTYKILVIFMFVLSTLFLTIMMLNILIAVISDSYSKVESTSVEEMYKNMADLICENEYLVRQRFLKAHDDMGDYLYVAKLDKTEGEDESLAKLNEVRNNIEKKTEMIEIKLKECQRSLLNSLHLQAEGMMAKYKEASNNNEVRFKNYAKKVEKAGKGGYLRPSMLDDKSPERKEGGSPDGGKRKSLKGKSQL